MKSDGFIIAIRMFAFVYTINLFIYISEAYLCITVFRMNENIFVEKSNKNGCILTLCMHEVSFVVCDFIVAYLLSRDSILIC